MTFKWRRTINISRFIVRFRLQGFYVFFTDRFSFFFFFFFLSLILRVTKVCTYTRQVINQLLSFFLPSYIYTYIYIFSFNIFSV